MLDVRNEVDTLGHKTLVKKEVKIMGISPLATKILQDVMRETIVLLPYSKRLNPQVKISTAKSKLGYCQYDRLTDKYTIFISKYVLDCSKDLIKSVLAHELIYTCKGCMNHGENFVRYMNILNYVHKYNIEIKNTNKEFGTKIKHKYKMTCLKCGATFYRNRITKNVEYIHPKDNGKIKIEQLY